MDCKNNYVNCLFEAKKKEDNKDNKYKKYGKQLEQKNPNSALCIKDISNYRDISIRKIAREILKIHPFEDYKSFFKLKKYIEWKHRNDPHRGNLNKALSREFLILKKSRKEEKQVKMKANKLEIIAIEFDIELISILYENRTPKTENIAKKHTLIDSKLIQKKHFQLVANELKEKYLLNCTVGKGKLNISLVKKIRDIREYVYPTRYDEIPK